MNLAIICVDDEAIILLSMKMELKKHFGTTYQIETAMNAQGALEILAELDDEQVQPAAIICDWLMPGQKGDEFLIQIHDRYPKAAKILVTGLADQDRIDQATAVGAIDICITKPWSSSMLIRNIEELLQKKQT